MEAYHKRSRLFSALKLDDFRVARNNSWVTRQENAADNGKRSVPVSAKLSARFSANEACLQSLLHMKLFHSQALVPFVCHCKYQRHHCAHMRSSWVRLGDPEDHPGCGVFTVNILRASSLDIFMFAELPTYTQTRFLTFCYLFKISSTRLACCSSASFCPWPGRPNPHSCEGKNIL